MSNKYTSSFVDSIIKSFFGTLSAIFSITVITKILATYIGPNAIAYFSLFREYNKLITQSISFKSNDALVQNFKKNYHNRNFEINSSILRFLIIFFSIYILLVSLILFFFQYKILLKLELESFNTLLILFITGVLGGINIVSIAFLNSNNKLLQLSISESIGYLFVMLLVVIFPLFFDNPDKIAYILFTINLVWLLFTILFNLKNPILRKIDLSSFKFKFSHIRGFISLSFGSLIVVIAGIYTNLHVKYKIIDLLGINGLGIFESAWTISSVYLLLLFSTFNKHVLPNFSIVKPEKINNTIENYISTSSFFISIMILTLLTFKEYIILLLYSDKFVESSSMLSLILIADYMKMISWILTLLMIAKNKTKLFVYGSFFFNIVLIFCLQFLQAENALIEFSYSYLIVQFVYLIFNLKAISLFTSFSIIKTKDFKKYIISFSILILQLILVERLEIIYSIISLIILIIAIFYIYKNNILNPKIDY
jgi:O-antigen/teichoic acid export membrane protein